jgi:hypothetical protein
MAPSLVRIRRRLGDLMTSTATTRFLIRFEPVYGALSTTVLMPPSKSYVELDSEQVRVRMSWGFRANFPKTAVKAVARFEKKPISRGVHGFAGRWLVNDSGDGIVTVDLASPSARS